MNKSLNPEKNTKIVISAYFQKYFFQTTKFLGVHMTYVRESTFNVLINKNKFKDIYMNKLNGKFQSL